MERFDVLVLGGGSAGCVVAARLSENPDRSVCLVEAGPDYGPYGDGRWPADILDAGQLALDSHCWQRDDEDDRSQLRARILGGCSAHNACVLLRGAPADYDEWGPVGRMRSWRRISTAERRCSGRGSKARTSFRRGTAPSATRRPTARSSTSFLTAETAEFERQHALVMAAVTVPHRTTACPPGLCDVFMFPAIDPGYEISAAVFAMKPRSRGSVRLTHRDPEAPLAIDHGFLRDDADADVLVEGVEALRKLVQAERPARYAGRELRPGDLDVGAYVRATARGFFHPVGTCGIGRVVDARLRVLGFDNLYVADASVMPTIPRANTHLSTVAIAERAAEWI